MFGRLALDVVAFGFLQPERQSEIVWPAAPILCSLLAVNAGARRSALATVRDSLKSRQIGKNQAHVESCRLDSGDWQLGIAVVAMSNPEALATPEKLTLPEHSFVVAGTMSNAAESALRQANLTIGDAFRGRHLEKADGHQHQNTISCRTQTKGTPRSSDLRLTSIDDQEALAAVEHQRFAGLELRLSIENATWQA